MKISDLQHLLLLEKCHSVSAAAAQLHQSKSTLSSTIKKIEKEIGIKLIQQTRRELLYTAEGEYPLALIRDICANYDAILSLKNQASTASRSIPIAISPTINSALALPLNKQFSKLDPCSNLEFQVMSGEKVGDCLLKCNNNIGVTYFEPQSINNYRQIASRYQVELTTLATDCLYLMIRNDHPLASKTCIRCCDLTGLHFAVLPHFYSAEDSISSIKHLGPDNRYFSFPSVALVKQAVLEQNMATLLPGYAIFHHHSQDNRHFKALRLSGLPEENTLYLCLIRQSDSALCYQEKLIIQCICEYFASLPPLSPR